jgi:predicted ferric reductase
MTDKTLYEYEKNVSGALFRIFLDGLSLFGVVSALAAGLLLLLPPVRQTLLDLFVWLTAADTVQVWWYVTRAAGLLAYLLLWLSTAWGLAVPSRLLTPLLEQAHTFEFHQSLSLLSIGFGLLHVLVLMFDRYMPYSAWQVLIPFLSPYRPLWVGIGVIALYLILLVTATFYIRAHIGMKTFRAIHAFSLLGYLGATLHGLFAGTDSGLPLMQLLYAGTALNVVFLTVYWLVMKLQENAAASKRAKLALEADRRP